MSKPRNPRHFPRMKVRGTRRRRIAGIQRLSGAFDRLSMTAWQAQASVAALTAAMRGAR